MRRKIVKQGKDTLTISIPREWARQNKLDQNDEVEMLENGKKLIISSDNNELKNYIKKEITIKKGQPFLRRYLNNYYRRGIDEISILFEENNVMSQIEDEVNQLLGFEIVEQNNNQIVIKNVSKVLEKEFDSLLRRLFFIVQNMLDDLIISIKKNDFNNLKKISEQEKTTNKIYLFCQRVLNKIGYSETYKIPFLYFLLEELEQLADNVNEISRIIQKNNKMPNSDILNYIEEFNKFFLLFPKAFYDFDMLKIKQIREKKFEITEKLKKQIKLNPLIIHYLLSSVTTLHQIELSFGHLINIEG
jgi:phosphate uptake regulator